MDVTPVSPTKDYREQINLLAKYLNGRTLDAAFVVLDPRQERNYDRGLCYLLEHVSVAKVYLMHYWGKREVMDAFIKAHPEYQAYIQKHTAQAQKEVLMHFNVALKPFLLLTIL